MISVPQNQVPRAFTCGNRIPSRASICSQGPVGVICQSKISAESGSLERRNVLLGLAASVVTVQAHPSPALAQDYEIFYGTASPPTSYGGYGGNAQEAAKYMFEYPVGWKSARPNKVEKGTQGIDCRVFNPRNKGQQITVITFGRAGEDNKSFRLTDIDTTIAGFAGADYDMQDALVSATDKVNTQREIAGQIYYDVQINSPDVSYFATVTFNEGKVFALFVKSPTKLFKADEAILRHVVDTFKTI